MKKLLLLTLAVLLAIPSFAQIVGVVTQDGIKYYLYAPSGEKPYAIVSGNQLTEKTDLVIPSTVSSEGTDYSVTEIGENAFEECESLTSIKIPNSVTSIGRYAFSGSGLTSIEIPNSITLIDSGAFADCSQLSSVKIPNSVTSIGAWAFSDSGLTSIKIPNSVTSIGVGAFSGTDLTFVEIPNSITSIGDEVFSECTRLASVIIPNSVTSIGEQSFAWTGLTSVEIPNSITYIGEEAFAECDSLKIVNYNAMNPVKAEKSIFSDKTYSDATLNIAEGALDAIKSTSPWKYFNNIQDKLSGLETVVDDIDSNLPKAVYDLRGIKVSETTEGLPAGIYIIRQGGKSKKVTID